MTSNPFKGVNFMTPQILEQAPLDPSDPDQGSWYELSRGEGIEGDVLWGVTFKPLLKGFPSAPFYSATEAWKYIKAAREATAQ